MLPFRQFTPTLLPTARSHSRSVLAWIGHTLGLWAGRLGGSRLSGLYWKGGRSQPARPLVVASLVSLLLLGAGSARLDAMPGLLQWQWRSPLPQGNDLYALTYVDDSGRCWLDPPFLLKQASPVRKRTFL